MPILYFIKSNKSYNLSPYFEKEAVIGDHTLTDIEDEEEEQADAFGMTEIPDPMPQEEKWYHGIDGIDGEIAVKNSGSEDAFRTVLKIFYESIDQKTVELKGFMPRKIGKATRSKCMHPGFSD